MRVGLRREEKFDCWGKDVNGVRSNGGGKRKGLGCRRGSRAFGAHHVVEHRSIPRLGSAYLTPETSSTHAPLSRGHFLAVDQSRSQKLLFFPAQDMAHQPDSARFQTLFEPALQAYEKKAGVSLAQHPLAIKLQNSDSVEAITSLLQDQARAFVDLQGSDKIMKSIKTTVSILSKLSSVASLVDAFGLVYKQELVPYFHTFDCFLSDAPTREGDTSLSCHLT